MLTGHIRSARTTTIDVEGDSLEAVTAALAAQAPAGFELISAPVRMRKGSTMLDATGTFEECGDIREIEASDLDGLRAQVPDGWRLLSVRA